MSDQGIERFEVTGNRDTGQPEMVRCSNPLGGGWVRFGDYDALRKGLQGEVEHCRDEIRKADEVARDWTDNEHRDGEAQAYSYVADRLSALLDSGGQK
jgi:hypothetical protein